MAFKVYDVDENQVICRKEFDLFEKQMNALHDAPEDQELWWDLNDAVHLFKLAFFWFYFYSKSGNPNNLLRVLFII